MSNFKLTAATFIVKSVSRILLTAGTSILANVIVANVNKMTAKTRSNK